VDWDGQPRIDREIALSTVFSEIKPVNQKKFADAGDRARSREQLLRSLGWNIERVWSTDWWIDPVKCYKISSIVACYWRIQEILYWKNSSKKKTVA
jgi:hypothetical protein